MIFEKIRKQDQPKSRSDSPKSSRTPFDVVVLDYRMPKKDGLQVARQILSVAPDQRIIIASAYTHELIGISRVEMLQKPFGFDVLLRLVEGAPEFPQRNIGQKSSVSEGRMPSKAEFNSEKDRLDEERSTRMDGRSDEFFRTPF
jgi:DNA-binding NtrC family response regulator